MSFAKSESAINIPEEKSGGGCCGGGEVSTSAEENVNEMGSRTGTFNRSGSIKKSGGGCCGGDDPTDDEELVEQLSRKMSSKKEEKSGCCGGCCGGGESDDQIGEGEGPISLMTMRSKRATAEFDDFDQAADSPEPVTESSPAPATPAAPKPVATPQAEQEEVEIVIDEGLYFLYLSPAGGSTCCHFSRSPNPKGLIYAKFTEKSKIPAFKFRGTGQTPLSDKCMAEKINFMKGVSLYLRAVKLYHCEVTLMTQECDCCTFEIFLMQNDGHDYSCTLMQVGDFFDLENYAEVVVSANDALSSQYGSKFVVNQLEWTNAVHAAKGYKGAL